MRVMGRLLALSAGIAFLASVSVSSAAGKGIPWQSDLKKAQTQAVKQKKLLMVDFSAPWWGACKALEEKTYPSPKVVDFAKKFVPVMVNVDKDAASARKFGVGSLPTILFINEKGKVVHDFLGFVSPDQMLKEMKTALTKAKKK